MKDATDSRFCAFSTGSFPGDKVTQGRSLNSAPVEAWNASNFVPHHSAQYFKLWSKYSLQNYLEFPKFCIYCFKSCEK
jgi:hypothetical protein